MTPETERALLRRILDHLAAGTRDEAAAVRTKPVAWYTDAAQFQRERDVLFRRRPLAIAPLAQLAAPGDFVTHDLSGAPVLAVMGRDGKRRAFLNVCRHRGTRVEWEACGAGRRAFVCPYHAWTYGDDGRLNHIPQERGFAGLERASHGLVALAAAEAAGMFWAIPDPAADPAPLGPLAAFAREIEGLGLGRAIPYAPRKLELACNWKLVHDASLDSYHVRHAHRRTIAAMFLDNVPVSDRFGEHIRVLLPKRSVAELARAAPERRRLREHCNPLYLLFPGTIALVEPDHTQIMSAWPVSPDRTVITGVTLIPEPPASDKARAHWDKNVEIFWTALAEDFALMESKHSTLRAGAHDALVFGRFERASHWFHDAVDGALSAGGTAAAPGSRPARRPSPPRSARPSRPRRNRSPGKGNSR